MGLLNSLLGRDSRGPSGLKPIVQRTPIPAVMARPGAAVAVAKPPPPALPVPTIAVPPPIPVRVDPAYAPVPPPVVQVEAPPPVRPVVIEAPPPPPRVETPQPARRNEELAHLRRGIVLQARGDHAGAIEAFSKAIEHDASCVEAWSGRGISREALGQVDEARSDYSKSIEIEVRAEIDRQLRSAA